MIKKLSAVLSAVVVFGLQSSVFATTLPPQTVPVDLTVGDIFSLTVTPNPISFGTVTAGQQTPVVVVHLNVATNRNHKWEVELNGDNLNIPATFDFPLTYNWAFDYNSVDASVALTPAPPAAANITGTLTPIIVRNDPGVLLNSDYAINLFANVPAAAIAGTYHANLFFTLTDDI